MRPPAVIVCTSESPSRAARLHWSGQKDYSVRKPSRGSTLSAVRVAKVTATATTASASTMIGASTYGSKGFCLNSNGRYCPPKSSAPPTRTKLTYSAAPLPDPCAPARLRQGPLLRPAQPHTQETARTRPAYPPTARHRNSRARTSSTRSGPDRSTPRRLLPRLPQYTTTLPSSFPPFTRTAVSAPPSSPAHCACRARPIAPLDRSAGLRSLTVNTGSSFHHPTHDTSHSRSTYTHPAPQPIHSDHSESIVR